VQKTALATVTFHPRQDVQKQFTSVAIHGVMVPMSVVITAHHRDARRNEALGVNVGTRQSRAAKKIEQLFPAKEVQEEALKSFSWTPLWNHRRASFLFFFVMGLLALTSSVSRLHSPLTDSAVMLVCGGMMAAGRPSAYVLSILFWAVRWLWVSAFPAFVNLWESAASISSWVVLAVSVVWLIIPVVWLLGGHQVEIARKKLLATSDEVRTKKLF